MKRTNQRRASTPAPNGNKNLAASRNGDTVSQAEAFRLKVGLAEMLKGGVIMDVMNAEQAEIAQEAGAVAVMALERIPSQIRKNGGVARMSDPSMIKRIQSVVDIPVMAKCRIGHLVEAQILEALEIDFIDESEVLTPADEANHVWKHEFKAPFVCGCRDLGEALRRIGEGAAMIRTKGEAGTGNVVEAVRHMRTVVSHMKRLTTLTVDELMAEAKTLGAPFELVREVARTGQLPVPNFAAGGVATPADAALMMKLGAQAVFVGSGIFEVGDAGTTNDARKAARKDQARMAKAIVQAVANWDRPDLLMEISTGLPQAMRGIALETLSEDQLLAKRGW